MGNRQPRHDDIDEPTRHYKEDNHGNPFPDPDPRPCGYDHHRRRSRRGRLLDDLLWHPALLRSHQHVGMYRQRQLQRGQGDLRRLQGQLTIMGEG